MNQVRAPRRGDVIEVTLEELDPKGRTTGTFGATETFGERTVRVRGGVPGERVEVRVHRRRRGDLEGEIVNVLEPPASARLAPASETP